ncbi:MAG: hypothetical protein IPP26_09630 [Flavobacteriales bacterium]|nr:hypothetical protein [Flavobacteriales bacterium]
MKRYVLQNSGTGSDAEDVFQEALDRVVDERERWTTCARRRSRWLSLSCSQEQMAGHCPVSSAQAHESGA